MSRVSAPVLFTFSTPYTRLNSTPYCYHSFVTSSMKEKHVTDPEQLTLQSYADAASFMGTKDWVVQCNQWLLTYSQEYFLQDGCKNAYIKRRRADYRQQYSSSLPSDVVASYQDQLSSFPRRKIRLLDVGSCYNPLVSLEGSENFEITALDICPAVPSVFQSNFLELEISDSSSEMVVTNEANSSGSAKLLSLPAEYFDVVAMSLVLSYLPTPDMRRTMIQKAWKLLDFQEQRPHHSGILLIVEKDSIFTKPSDDKSQSLLSVWREAFSSNGFESVKYDKKSFSNRKAHIFAFRRTASSLEINKRTSADAARLWIRQDQDQSSPALHSDEELEKKKRRTGTFQAVVPKNES
jgi:25S rRNA (adenine(2142)-N(1))-methyltransferase, Bmt2